MRSDSGIILSWLIRLVLIVTLLGGAGFEFGSIAVNRIQAQDVAAQTAVEANLIFDGRSLDGARARAADYAALNGAKLIDLSVTGGRIYATIKKTAKTRVLQRFRRFNSWRVVTETESAPLRK